MKNKLLLLAILPFMLLACDQQPGSNANQGEGNQGQTDGGTGTGNTDGDQTPTTESYDFVINRSNINQTNNNNVTNFTTAMLNNINGDSGNYATTVSATGYVQINNTKITTTGGEERLYFLTVGSKSSDGSLSLTFNSTIYSATIYARSQFSAYAIEGVYYVTIQDEAAKITVNESEWDLTVSDKTVIPTLQSKKFDINSNTLTISANMAERVYIEKITFNFVVED